MVETPSLLLAFAAGFVSFLSPCCLPLVPGYLAAVCGERPDRQRGCVDPAVLARSLAFVATFSLIFVLFGLSATLLGSVLFEQQRLLERVAGVAMGATGALFVARRCSRGLILRTASASAAAFGHASFLESSPDPSERLATAPSARRSTEPLDWRRTRATVRTAGTAETALATVLPASERRFEVRPGRPLQRGASGRRPGPQRPRRCLPHARQRERERRGVVDSVRPRARALLAAAAMRPRLRARPATATARAG